MKKIFIIRHAKAEYNSNIDDHERCLTDKGIRDCAKVAGFLHTKKASPELILCSSAKRTQDTIKHILSSLSREIKINISDALYRAGVDEIISEISAVNDNISQIMIVCHNPGIHDFCNHFAKHGNTEDIIRLKTGVTPASIALFTFNDITSWGDISDDISNLEWYYNP
jgi:phosphohistidine phosphatase